MRVFSQEEIDEAKSEVRAMFGDEVCEVSQVGSTYISGAGEDLDLVVRLRERGFKGWDLLDAIEGHGAILDQHGYISTGQDSGNEDDFATYRKGDVNLMVTYDVGFIAQFEQAAEVCKYVHGLLFKTHGHGLDKVHRIKIHRIIMNEEEA